MGALPNMPRRRLTARARFCHTSGVHLFHPPYTDNLSPFLVQWHLFGHPIGIRWYGLNYVFSFFLVYLYFRGAARRGRVPGLDMAAVDALTYAIAIGIVGRRADRLRGPAPGPAAGRPAVPVPADGGRHDVLRRPDRGAARDPLGGAPLQDGVSGAGRHRHLPGGAGPGAGADHQLHQRRTGGGARRAATGASSFRTRTMCRATRPSFTSRHPTSCCSDCWSRQPLAAGRRPARADCRTCS